jgi:hypothetical protein
MHELSLLSREILELFLWCKCNKTIRPYFRASDTFTIYYSMILILCFLSLLHFEPSTFQTSPDLGVKMEQHEEQLALVSIGPSNPNFRMLV